MATKGKRRTKCDADDFQVIPGVGPSISKDLRDLGYSRVYDLRGGDPQRMYDRLVELRGSHIDRCVLYVFRCAVYYSENDEHDAELLKWWNWKERN